MEHIGSLLLAVAIIILNGTFVAAEFAIARLRKTQIDHIVLSKNITNRRKVSKAKLLQKILANINDYISACQVGITISSLVLGAYTEATLEEIISPWVAMLPLGFDSHTLSIFLAIAIVTFFHVIFGEIIPKNLSLINPEAISMQLCYFLEFVYTIFRLPVKMLNLTSNLCLSIIGVEVNEHKETHSEDEIKMILSSSQEEGIIEEEEEKLIQNVFDFNDTVAKDVMTPRTDMACIEAGSSLEEATHIINQSSFTKFPIYSERLDNIIGYVHIKDLLKAYEAGNISDPIESIALEIPKVPDGMYIIDLIQLLQSKKKQIAILIDEYGGTSGLATIEDIVEEIFGEIEDEHEIASNPLVKLNNGDYLADGTVTLKDINDEIGSEFESEHYETIGGFVYGLIGKEPQEGDEISTDKFLLKVEKHSNNRVRSVKIQAK